MNRDGGILAMFIAVVIPFIFIQSEVGVRSCVDAQLDRVLLAGSRFDSRAERHNRTSSGINRDSFDRSFRCNSLAAGYNFACPEINPVVAWRKVNRALR